MKIVHLIAPAPAGGAESAVRSLAIGQRALGHDVEVATLTSRTDDEHPFVRRLRQDGLAVTDIRSGRLDYLAESRAVGELLALRGADVLHTHVYHADIVGFVSASQHSVPHVATMHGFTGGGARLAAYVKFDMWVLRRCAAVIAVSPNVREAALGEGLRPYRVHNVPNGYEPAPEAALDRAAARDALGILPNSQVIGWVGRLSEEKGADMALEAFARMKPRCATLCIIGDGHERVNLELIARHLNISDRVRFVGHVSDAAKYLNAFDALLLSSRTEGTPMVLLEAMAARIPIVSFSVGGVPAMLPHDAALLVSPGDVSALSRAMSFAVRCPVASQGRAEVAHQTFERLFSVTKYASRVVDIYSQVTRGQSVSKGDDAPARRLSRLQPFAKAYIPVGM